LRDIHDAAKPEKGNKYMGLLNLLFSDPFSFIVIAVPLMYAIIFHELAHGWVAYQMAILLLKTWAA
jgi:hypothetical protein